MRKISKSRLAAVLAVTVTALAGSCAGVSYHGVQRPWVELSRGYVAESPKAVRDMDTAVGIIRGNIQVREFGDGIRRLYVMTGSYHRIGFPNDYMNAVAQAAAISGDPHFLDDGEAAKSLREAQASAVKDNF